MTGQRPFLPHLSPGQWVDLVEGKQPEHIAVVESLEGRITYLTNLVPESRVSRPLAAHLEKWLRFLLGNHLLFTYCNLSSI